MKVGPEEYGGHAQRAHEAGALGTLCQLTSHAGMAPNAAEMASNILIRWVGGWVGGLDWQPAAVVTWCPASCELLAGAACQDGWGGK